jgi:putative ABC transport system ATP-binding protein
LLAAPPAVLGGVSTLPNRAVGGLRLSGLSYGALCDVDLEIEPGELVGVVAPDPAVLRGVRDDRYIVTDLATASALRSPTVLSIQWGLEQIRPSLARVATS